MKPGGIGVAGHSHRIHDQTLIRTISRDASTALLSAFTLVFFEWLFFVTMPSFASPMTWIERALLLFATAGLLAIPLQVAQLFATGIARLLPAPAAAYVSIALPAFVLSCLALLLADNFMHTIFFLGLVAAPLGRRVLYLAGFVAALVLISRSLARTIRGSRGTILRATACSAAAVAAICLAILYARRGPPPRMPDVARDSIRPYNVLILTSDGINAEFTSLYGRTIPTTPFLDSFARGALVCRNAFPNAPTTLGSLTSILTGKLPTETKVTYAPQTLRGRDALEHMPGILQRLGYRTLHVSIRHYGDVTDAGLALGFDTANGRSTSSLPIALLIRATSTAYLDAIYFAGRIVDRIELRLAAIFTLREIPDEYGLVSGKVPPKSNDAERVRQVLAFIRSKPNVPWMAQVHLLDSHCCAFDLDEPYKSGIAIGPSASINDRVVRRADDYFKEIVEGIRDSGQLEKTIIVISADHALLWHPMDRIPLLIRLPHGAGRGEIANDVQLIDLPTTILPALGVTPPPWMKGRNLFDPAHLRDIPILAASRISKSDDWAQSRRLIVRDSPLAPYGVEAVSVVQGCHWAELDLATDTVTSGTVKGHTLPCAGTFDQEQAAGILRRHVAATLRHSANPSLHGHTH